MKNENIYTNQLIEETSPYLLQHAHNPVDWYPWGKEAFQKAKKENKLVIISIGYAACHWCHVMEKESFENPTIAQLMNSNFICIKVDREERPDIDQYYMTAVQLLTGQGGWPLNCFALPDGRPIWGGTYFPPDQWKAVLSQFSRVWKQDPSKYRDYATRLTHGIRRTEELQLDSLAKSPTQEIIDQHFNHLKKEFDPHYGGFKQTQKFPLPSAWEFVMHYATLHPEGLEQLETTLLAMANGGIYDHLGGGFARYSVDPFWKIPHFEKMLYDNAQLIDLFSQAHRQNPHSRYREVVFQTVEFLKRELRDPDGGFFSSLDADSEGEEGRYYVWTEDEIDRLLDRDATLFKSFYSIKPKGNWEKGKNVLHITTTIEDLAQNTGRERQEIQEILEKQRELLFKSRESRTPPTCDTKILTSWNALIIKGLSEAFLSFGDPDFLNLALQNAQFIETHLRTPEGALWRTYAQNRAHTAAFLEDYVLLAQAYTSLYQASLDTEWLQKARELVLFIKEHFHDPETGFYFSTSVSRQEVAVRQKELSDNVIPSPNSILARTLFSLGILHYDNDFLKEAEKLFQQVLPIIGEHSSFYTNWLTLGVQLVTNPYEIVIIGPKAPQWHKEIASKMPPGSILAATSQTDTLPIFKGRMPEEGTLIYICQNRTCQQPVSSVEEAIKIISS